MVPCGHRATQANGVLSERTDASESKDPFPLTSTLHIPLDDGIVVTVHEVYILRCADGSLYVGSTDDLARRLRRHNEGRAATFTAERRPVTLAYSEQHPSRVTARRREAQLKRWTTAKKEALIAGDYVSLHSLARRPHCPPSGRAFARRHFAVDRM
jgi:putative endonuclease